MSEKPDQEKKPDRYEPQCRLCQLSKSPPDTLEFDLYKFIRDQAMKGASYNSIKKNMDEYIKKISLNYKPVNRQSIWNHFEKHVSLQALATIHSSRENWIPMKENPLVDERIVALVSKENFDEYDELCKLYTRFKEINNQIYEYTDSLKTKRADGEEHWSQPKIQTYVSMVNTQKSILAEISKMRQGDKLIAIATKFIIETFTRNLIGKLKSEFDSFASIMKRQSVHDDVIEAFEGIATSRLTQMFVEEAIIAMDITKKEFKLPN